MARFHFIVLALVGAAVLTDCSSPGVSFTGPNPAPRDVTTPEELSSELASLRIFWAGGDTSVGNFVRIDGTNPLSIFLPDYAVSVSASSSAHFFVYATSLLPGANIELLNAQNGEREVLVRGEEQFPGAILGFPSFSQDELSVVFEVSSGDRIDLAILNIEDKNVQFLDMQGGFNKWPKFSPSGGMILVGCEDEERPGFTLCILDQKTRIRRYLIDDLVVDDGEFTSNGQLIVYVAIPDGILGEGQLYRVGVDGEDKKQLVTGLYSGAGILGATTEDVVFTCRFPERPACTWVCTSGLDGRNVRRLMYLGNHCIDVNEQ